MIHYTVKVNNPYLLALTLVKMRIPFEFNPTQKYRKKNWKNGFGNSVFEIDLLIDGESGDKGVDQISIADILFEISKSPRGEGFQMTIIHQHEY